MKLLTFSLFKTKILKCITTVLSVQMVILPVAMNQGFAQNAPSTDVRGSLTEIESRGWKYLVKNEKNQLIQVSTAQFLAGRIKNFYVASPKPIPGLGNIVFGIQTEGTEKALTTYISAFQANDLVNSLADGKAIVSSDKTDVQNKTSFDRSIQALSRKITKKVLAMNVPAVKKSMAARIANAFLPSAEAKTDPTEVLFISICAAAWVAALIGFVGCIFQYLDGQVISNSNRWMLIIGAILAAGLTAALVTINDPHTN